MPFSRFSDHEYIYVRYSDAPMVSLIKYDLSDLNNIQIKVWYSEVFVFIDVLFISCLYKYSALI
jgi:hypothetical protein